MTTNKKSYDNSHISMMANLPSHSIIAKLTDFLKKKKLNLFVVLPKFVFFFFSILSNKQKKKSFVSFKKKHRKFYLGKFRFIIIFPCLLLNYLVILLYQLLTHVTAVIVDAKLLIVKVLMQ